MLQIKVHPKKEKEWVKDIEKALKKENRSTKLLPQAVYFHVYVTVTQHVPYQLLFCYFILKLTLNQMYRNILVHISKCMFVIHAVSSTLVFHFEHLAGTCHFVCVSAFCCYGYSAVK